MISLIAQAASAVERSSPRMSEVRIVGQLGNLDCEEIVDTQQGYLRFVESAELFLPRYSAELRPDRPEKRRLGLSRIGAGGTFIDIMAL
jgi:hypothetical protein